MMATLGSGMSGNPLQHSTNAALQHVASALATSAAGVRSRPVHDPGLVTTRPVHDKDNAMGFVRWLAVLPFLGILVGVPLLNQVEPMVLGMPLVLAWVVLWIILTAGIMTIIYMCDPANRGDA